MSLPSAWGNCRAGSFCALKSHGRKQVPSLFLYLALPFGLNYRLTASFHSSNLLCCIVLVNMSFAPLSNLYVAPARNVQPISQENVKPHAASHSGPDRIHTLNRTPDDEPDWDSPRDSVTKRRRHAVYMHRPPVWYPEPRTPKRCIPVVEDSAWSDVVDEDDTWDPFCQSKSPHYQQRVHDPCLGGLEHESLDTSVGRLSEEQTKFEQQLYCDITAAMAEAQAADVDVPESHTPLPVSLLLF